MGIREKGRRTEVVTEVAPELIDFADFNPRGESQDQIEQDPEYVQLRESVSRFGVMVPLVVARSPRDSSRFVLIDGERRLRAALSVREGLVPVRVVSSQTGDALMQSFHIHSLRKQWGPTAYVRAVGRLVERLRAEDPGVVRRENELRQKVCDLTGLVGQNLERYVRTALRYDEAHLKEVDEGTINISHLWEIEESFIEQVKGKFPRLLARIGEKVVRKMMLVKARQGVLSGTRALRPLSSLFTSVVDTSECKRLESLVQDFVETEGMSPEEVVSKFRADFPERHDDLLMHAETIRDQVAELTSSLKVLRMREFRELYPAAARQFLRVLGKLRAGIDRLIPRKRS
jgi:hypothetical protein